MVNNGNYLSYFEVGRVEWLRAAGLSYRELEARGYGLVVVEAFVRYRKGARFDDELRVRTRLSEIGRASLRFEYEILRGDETITTGYTRHGCVKLAGGRATHIPKDVLENLRSARG